MLNKGGIYIHIPVCRRKCFYCSFYSVGERKIKDWRRFADAILKEFDTRINEVREWQEITIYIGGGTPSLMPPDVFRYLLDSIVNRIGEINPSMKISEVTVEVNPDDVTVEMSAFWKEAGVNRVSMGVQSLVDSELKSIGRRHDAATALSAYRILSEQFDNISLDLIFGLPGQTLETLKITLDGFMALRPDHISAYSLMFEERSALTRMRDSGNLEETDEDITVSMFRMVNDILSANGYHRYEISNYALPGREAVHNSSYWKGLPYVGLGPSAHSYDGISTRRWNVEDLDKYIKGVENGIDFYEIEVLNDSELLEERIMTGLRTAEGVSLSGVRRDFGEMAMNKILKKAESALSAGYIVVKDDYIMLTDKGVMVSDEIILQLF